MKNLIFLFMLMPIVAEAQSPQVGYKYQTTYRDFDYAFYSEYRYNESVPCRRVYRNGWVSRTCYDFEPSETVYIQEQVTNNGYTRVSVYRYQYDSTPYADYYVYDGTIERRYYYSTYPTYYTRVYYGPGYSYRSTVWVSLDWNNGWDKVIIGSYWAAVGTQIAANSAASGSSAGVALGLGSALSGSVSMSAGSNQIDEESRLQRRIRNQRRRDSSLNVQE